ncbi:M3 family oligoendopeptidase [Paenalkalicoccus suaedae]|uniref:M3 family oligoendopeptidase n=1 Tax=Paenalkalicoccus suaedae TaxID=2592382 RepID=A0A859FD64_9BACI|nr:M3 family oligoendopeptidase [Paenalkalicoccus suaedae]QKS70692.1 M3 family oligoendopeptidase [Paenalkalicoccus suaedae]
MTSFYVEKIDFSNTKELEGIYTKLLEEEITSATQLEDWLIRYSRVQDEVEEILSGHYIEFQCQSDSESAKEAVEFDQDHIEPIKKAFEAKLDEKILQSPYLSELPSPYYDLFIQSTRNAKSLFREQNIALEVEEAKLANAYFETTGGLTVEWDGEEKTLSQISPYAQVSDREVRKKAVTLQANAFLSVQDKLQGIMDELLVIRKKKADNAGLANYRDYMFKKYERFDYTPEDCKQLAEAIKKHVVPLKEELQRKHKEELGVDEYRPWDTAAVKEGLQPLKPFETSEELVGKGAHIFRTLDPRFAELLETMDQRGMLDLTSRKGKAPGGFCSKLPVSELSFIFMNASKTHGDMITLLHEMGHCIHNDFTTSLDLSAYRETPMESAELASMSMELLTMDQWDHYYPNEEDLIRAKKDHLEDIINFLPLGMVVDQFQHWLYENPGHTATERNAAFKQIKEELDSTFVNFDGMEDWQEAMWLRILHIFEVPFYFIEYVIAQLGALQLFKNYRQDKEKAIKQYTDALKLGSSKSLPEVYEAAGIRFDFSQDLIKELMEFLQSELQALN